jgi:hypothetical protein
MPKPVFVKGAALCGLANSILVNAPIAVMAVDKNLIPAAIRRRTSETTRIAITAAYEACRQAGLDPKTAPAVFASLGGEIQITDALCRLLPTFEPLSPTQFHNSVHNTTAGYWTIIQGSQLPVTAIAALDDTFAMGLLEAWTQLQMTAETVLLVCYDEHWPQYLSAPIGSCALACALVLSTDKSGACAEISKPLLAVDDTLVFPDKWRQWAEVAPAAAALPLLSALYRGGRVPLNSAGAVWHTDCVSFKHESF